MRIPVIVLTAILAAMFFALAVPKLTGQRQMLDRMAHLGVSAGLTRILGVLEIAAVAGFLLGLFWPLLGVAAAVGIVAQMIGAAVYHARAKDPVSVVVTPIGFGVMAVVLAVLHLVGS